MRVTVVVVFQLVQILDLETTLAQVDRNIRVCPLKTTALGLDESVRLRFSEASQRNNDFEHKGLTSCFFGRKNAAPEA